MTEYQLNNFDDTKIHLWIPEFMKDADDWDQVWVTFCYAVAINSGLNKRYEFHLHDYGLMTPDSMIDKFGVIERFNAKYGEWIKMWYKDGAEASFTIVKKNWNFIETFIGPGTVQRKWIHLYSQIFDCDGFRHDVFTEEEGLWKGLAKRYAWSSTTKEDAWWMSDVERKRWVSRCKPSNGRPQYLRNPLRKGGTEDGEIIPSFRGAPLKYTAKLKHTRDEQEL